MMLEIYFLSTYNYPCQSKCQKEKDRYKKSVLTYKAPSKIVADNVLIFVPLFFRENKTWHLLGRWFTYQALFSLLDNSCEMPSLI